MSASCSSRVRLEVSTTTGGVAARIVPYSGIVTWYVDSTSSRNASNSSSARSTSSTSSTAGLCCRAASTGRASRKRSSYKLFSASVASIAPSRSTRRLQRPQVQDLAREVPVVERLGGVDALVALEPDQRQVQRLRERLGERGLAGAGLALQQQRPLHPQREEGDRGEVVVAQVAGRPEPRGDLGPVGQRRCRLHSSRLLSVTWCRRHDRWRGRHTRRARASWAVEVGASAVVARGGRHDRCPVVAAQHDRVAGRGRRTSPAPACRGPHRRRPGGRRRRSRRAGRPGSATTASCVAERGQAGAQRRGHPVGPVVGHDRRPTPVRHQGLASDACGAEHHRHRVAPAVEPGPPPTVAATTCRRHRAPAPWASPSGSPHPAASSSPCTSAREGLDEELLQLRGPRSAVAAQGDLAVGRGDEVALADLEVARTAAAPSSAAGGASTRTMSVGSPA